MSCVYFVLWLPEDQPSATAAFVKCLPILALIWFVWLQGISGDGSSYNQKILVGLVFSCLGDTLLVWQEELLVFLLGMGFFGCALVAYTFAFGFFPFGTKELVVCISLLLPIFSIMLPPLSGVLLYAIACYGLLLGLMAWRAMARFHITSKEPIPWRKIYATCGSILFASSDLVIAINKFCWPVSNQRAVIMVTYYAAQFCITLSVVKSQQKDKDGRSKWRERNSRLTSLQSPHTEADTRDKQRNT